MSYTPMSDLGQQGLFDITRLLLQQPDLAALSETLTRLVQQSALATKRPLSCGTQATTARPDTPAMRQASR
ncbi:hypothetical protein G7L32_03340 [Klebsiella quasipneumoniae]|nr:hypothetical protein [Klebsiella quasipneumoniae]NGX22543.1 hypothetical protein [Klebsiella quasipneumoniae]